MCRQSDTAQQLEDSTQALEALSIARKHTEQRLNQVLGHSSGSSSPEDREASRWDGLAAGHSSGHNRAEDTNAGSVSLDGAVGVEGAEREVERVERELAHAKARVRELRSRQTSQRQGRGSAADGGSGWGPLLESPDSGFKGRSGHPDASGRGSPDLPGGENSALRDLEARVSRLEDERAAATAQLHRARLRSQSGRQNCTHAHERASQHGHRHVHGDGLQAAGVGEHGETGLHNLFTHELSLAGARTQDLQGLHDLVGTFAGLQEEVAAALTAQGADPSSDVQQRLRMIAASLQDGVASADASVKQAQSAAAASDARANVLASHLRAVGMSDEVNELLATNEALGTEHSMASGSQQPLQDLRVKLEDAQREVVQLQAALEDAQRVVEAQAAELAALRGVAATNAAAGAAAVCATSPDTSAGSNPLISAWAPGSSAALGADPSVATSMQSPSSTSAEHNALHITGGDVLSRDADGSRRVSSLIPGASVAAIMAPEGSGQLLDAALRMGSQSGSPSGLLAKTMGSDHHLPGHSSSDNANLLKSRSSMITTPEGNSNFDGDRAVSSESAHGTLLSNLLDVSNERGDRDHASSLDGPAGKVKETFMGVDLSDIDGSSLGGPSSTRQSSPYASHFPSVLIRVCTSCHVTAAWMLKPLA